jgi:phosphopantetheinyl transferase (holo-ACP synthase)
MIGNDVVDLALAQKQSNWQRKGFLDKIFTKREQILIQKSKNQTTMVWNLWSRKEAVYKIYNRETGIRGYFPLKLECFYESPTLGTVCINDLTYYTQTQLSEDKIHTIAVAKNVDFESIKILSPNLKISKTNGIPFLFDVLSNTEKPVSISHHGRFWEGITV